MWYVELILSVALIGKSLPALALLFPNWKSEMKKKVNVTPTNSPRKNPSPILVYKAHFLAFLHIEQPKGNSGLVRYGCEVGVVDC